MRPTIEAIGSSGDCAETGSGNFTFEEKLPSSLLVIPLLGKGCEWEKEDTHIVLVVSHEGWFARARLALLHVRSRGLRRDTTWSSWGGGLEALEGKSGNRVCLTFWEEGRNVVSLQDHIQGTEALGGSEEQGRLKVTDGRRDRRNLPMSVGEAGTGAGRLGGYPD